MPKESNSRSHLPPSGGKIRLGRFALIGGALVALFLTVAAVALLWKPSAVPLGAQRVSLLQVLAGSSIPEAAANLLSTGRGTVRITEPQLALMLSALLDGEDVLVPGAVRDRIRDSIPEWVKSVPACEITAEGITLYVKCERAVSFYVTIRGRITSDKNRDPEYGVTSVRLGLLPLPQGLVDNALPERVVRIPRSGYGAVVLSSIATEQGALLVELSRERRQR